MAAGKRPARRAYRWTPAQIANVSRDDQGPPTVGDIVPGASDIDTNRLARPKVVRYIARPYSEAEVMQISILRQERWAILAECSARPNIRRLDESRYIKMRKRLAKVNSELYEITGNPVYDVEE
jgi:hypothetical protein